MDSVHAIGAASTLSIVRAFSESTYLDKNVVTDRVLSVVKNFDKVDPSKVRDAQREHVGCSFSMQVNRSTSTILFWEHHSESLHSLDRKAKHIDVCDLCDKTHQLAVIKRTSWH